MERELLVRSYWTLEVLLLGAVGCERGVAGWLLVSVGGFLNGLRGSLRERLDELSSCARGLASTTSYVMSAESGLVLWRRVVTTHSLYLRAHCCGRIRVVENLLRVLLSQFVALRRHTIEYFGGFVASGTHGVYHAAVHIASRHRIVLFSRGRREHFVEEVLG